jgi:hypothetical protein
MGDGSKIRLWHDVWYGEKALKEAFSDIYNIAYVKDASGTVYLELSSGSLKWNVSFIRAAHDWEMDVFALFFNLLYLYRVRREDEDKL